MKPLYVWRWLAIVKRNQAAWTKDASTGAPFVQVVIALGAIIGGAQLFIGAVDGIADRFGVPPLAFTLLVAPAMSSSRSSTDPVDPPARTPSPSGTWGAMVFQSSFPVTIGLLLTPWNLAHEALVAAIIALVAGAVLYATVRFRGRLTARLLLVQGVFYVGYVAYVVTKF